MKRDELAGLRFSLAGPGRVGASLAAWAVACGARPVEIAGRDPGGSAARLAAALGARPVSLENLESGGQNFLLVAVSDGALDGVAATLARRAQADVVWHTAGSRDASSLAALRAGGSAIGSLHPLRAFPAPLERPGGNTLFAIDGDPAATELARRLAAAWDGQTAEVPAEARRLYHLAASLAAGGVVTLVALAGEIARRLGLPEAVAEGYRQLAAGAIAAVPAGADPAGRITGPVARGDVDLVLRQVDELATFAPESAALVTGLALETLRLLGERQPLDAGQSLLREELRGRRLP